MLTASALIASWRSLIGVVLFHIRWPFEVSVGVFNGQIGDLRTRVAKRTSLDTVGPRPRRWH